MLLHDQWQDDSSHDTRNPMRIREIFLVAGATASSGHMPTIAVMTAMATGAASGMLNAATVPSPSHATAHAAPLVGAWANAWTWCDEADNAAEVAAFVDSIKECTTEEEKVCAWDNQGLSATLVVRYQGHKNTEAFMRIGSNLSDAV